jgi:predicted nucleic acid-binding protein
MLVVTDTAPIKYLILIGYVDVLPVLHGDIIIPQAVAVELMNPRIPEIVRQWIAAPPA